MLTHKSRFVKLNGWNPIKRWAYAISYTAIAQRLRHYSWTHCVRRVTIFADEIRQKMILYITHDCYRTNLVLYSIQFLYISSIEYYLFQVYSILSIKLLLIFDNNLFSVLNLKKIYIFCHCDSLIHKGM